MRRAARHESWLFDFQKSGNRKSRTRSVKRLEIESRGTTLNGSQIHSIRLPGYVIGVEAIFGARDERLTIRHDAGSGAEPYIQGTLLAIREVKNHVGLIRGLDKIMK